VMARAPSNTTYRTCLFLIPDAIDAVKIPKNSDE
jgi:hypothetical protein